MPWYRALGKINARRCPYDWREENTTFTTKMASFVFLGRLSGGNATCAKAGQVRCSLRANANSTFIVHDSQAGSSLHYSQLHVVLVYADGMDRDVLGTLLPRVAVRLPLNSIHPDGVHLEIDFHFLTALRSDLSPPTAVRTETVSVS